MITSAKQFLKRPVFSLRPRMKITYSDTTWPCIISSLTSTAVSSDNTAAMSVELTVLLSADDQRGSLDEVGSGGALEGL